MIHKLLLLIPIFVFTYIHSHAQDKAKGLTTSDSLLTYMGRLMLSGKNLMQEKVYLHFDNTGYFLGEKIWFKAYVTRAYDCKPTDISRVLYFFVVGRRVILTNGFVKKTMKTPLCEIERAKRYRADFNQKKEA